MEMKPKVLVLADDDYVNGVKKGYYPEHDTLRENNNLEFITLREARNNADLWKLDKTDKEEAVFILDPYTQGYIRTDNKDLHRTIITNKAIAFQRALLNMGAHCVILTKMVHDAKNSTIDSGLHGGKKGIFGANASVKHENGEVIDLSGKLCTLKKNNTPKSVENVKKQLIDTGLINDSFLRDLFDEFRETGKLSENKKVEFHFKSELDSALDIAANIDYGAIGGGINVGIKKKEIHEVNQSLIVYFDEVPKDIELYMEEHMLS